MDLSTSTRPNAKEVGLALHAMGAKVDVCDSLITATRNGVTVYVRLCRENIPFIWWHDEEGGYHMSTSVAHAMDALHLTGPTARRVLRDSTVIARLLETTGVFRRSYVRADVVANFGVKREYNQKHQRVGTLVDFFDMKSSDLVAEQWDTLSRALSMTPYRFYLHKIGKVRYLSTIE